MAIKATVIANDDVRPVEDFDSPVIPMIGGNEEVIDSYEPIGEAGDYIVATYKDGSLRRRIRGNLDKGEADKVFEEYNASLYRMATNGEPHNIESVLWYSKDDELVHSAGH